MPLDNFFSTTPQPSFTPANDDLSPADKVLREQYCGQLDILRQSPQPATAIVTHTPLFGMVKALHPESQA